MATVLAAIGSRIRAIREEERQEQSLEVPAPASAGRPRLRSFGRWLR